MIGQMLQVAAMLQLATVPPIVLLSHAELSGLRFDWNVTKSATPAPNAGSVSVFNLGIVQRKALAAFVAESPVPLTVQLLVGWGLVPELLLTGQAYRVQAEVKRDVDVLTEIEFADGAIPARDTAPGGGAVVGQTAALKAQLLLASLGLVPNPSALAVIAERAGQLPITAWHDTGEQPVRQQLDDLMSTLGLSWGVQDGFFVVYRDGLRNDLLPSVLSPQSGLLNAHQLDDGGVQFEALAQVRTVPGLQVQILQPATTQTGGFTTLPVGGGPLRIESVTFRGSSHGPSTMAGTARKVQLL